MIRSENGILAFNIAMPKSLEGPGGASNPEQLFVADYAACYESPILKVARDLGICFADPEVEVIAEIRLHRNNTGVFFCSPVWRRRSPAWTRPRQGILLVPLMLFAPVPMRFAAMSR